MLKRLLLPGVLWLLAGAVQAQGKAAVDCAAPTTQDALAACAARELRESDARINQLYGTVMERTDTAGRESLRQSQREWIRQRDSECMVPRSESDRERWYAALAASPRVAACVTEQTRYRIAVLEAQSEGRPVPSREAVAAQRSATSRMAHTTPDARGNPRLPTRHVDGKWYFEVTIDRAATARLGTREVMAGFISSDDQFIGTAHRLHASDQGSFTIGCAIDLDAGMVYFREGGSWNGKEPGSNLGAEVKLGREYSAAVRVAELMEKLTAAGAVLPNFGDTPFVHALPEGYRSWR